MSAPSSLPPSLPASLAGAAQAFERGDFAAVERLAGAASQDSDALHLLALVRLEQQRLEEAVALLQRALGLRPGHPIMLLNLARALTRLGRDGEAGQALEQALAIRPNLTDAWVELGQLQMRGGDPNGAEASLCRALEIAPEHGPAKLWLGVLLKNNGRAADAEAVLAQGLGEADDASLKAALAYNLAFAQYHQGKKQSALENFTAAGRLDNGSLNTEIARADLLEEMLRFDEAVALLEQGVARDPANPAMHFAYNDLLHRLGRDGEFLKSYDSAPSNPALASGKASFLLKTGRLDEAYGAYADVLKHDPASLEASVGAASILNQQGRHGEAIATLQQAVRHHPASALLHQNLAAAALQARDPQKAAAMAEKSLMLSPVDQTGLAVLGSAWRMMGDARDEMLNSYDELIQAFDLQTPQGFSSMAAFNDELNGWLEAMHPKTREPLQQSLRHGSQTRGHMFGRGHDLAEKLKTRIDEAITHYLAGIKPDARHPFRGRRGQGFRMADSWSSRLVDCGFHINHVHPGGWISSCYYVALPDAVKDETQKQGWIKFGEPNFDAGLGIRKAIQPVAGRLVLFPSYMWHGTIPFHSSSARTTIAFDAVPDL